MIKTEIPMQENREVILRMSPSHAVPTIATEKFQEDEVDEEGWHVVTGRQKSSRSDYSLDTNLALMNTSKPCDNNYFNGSSYSPIRNRQTNPFLSACNEDTRMNISTLTPTPSKNRDMYSLLKNDAHTVQVNDRVQKYKKRKRHNLGKNLNEFLENGINLETIVDVNSNSQSTTSELPKSPDGSKSEHSSFERWSNAAQTLSDISFTASTNHDENRNFIASESQKCLDSLEDEKCLRIQKGRDENNSTCFKGMKSAKHDNKHCPNNSNSCHLSNTRKNSYHMKI